MFTLFRNPCHTKTKGCHHFDIEITSYHPGTFNEMWMWHTNTQTCIFLQNIRDALSCIPFYSNQNNCVPRYDLVYHQHKNWQTILPVLGFCSWSNFAAVLWPSLKIEQWGGLWGFHSLEVLFGRNIWIIYGHLSASVFQLSLLAFTQLVTVLSDLNGNMVNRPQNETATSGTATNKKQPHTKATTGQNKQKLIRPQTDTVINLKHS